MHFTKMHGAGNDFIIINNIEEKISYGEFPALAKRLCAPHTGAGADGLMAVTAASHGGDYGMLFFNADGSAGEMCGNGARCIARYGYENGLAGETQRIETVSGTVTGQRISERLYRVRLNDPSLIDLHRTVRLGGTEYDCSYIELGVPGLPHAVLLKQDFDAIDHGELFALGRTLRYAPEFPKGANVTFVKTLGRGVLKAVTFERGVEDFTLACGTGCGSVVTALALRGVIPEGRADIEMPGGTLSVSLTAENGSARDIYLTGPAVIIFSGHIMSLSFSRPQIMFRLPLRQRSSSTNFLLMFLSFRFILYVSSYSVPIFVVRTLTSSWLIVYFSKRSSKSPSYSRFSGIVILSCLAPPLSPKCTAVSSSSAAENITKNTTASAT